jgi:tRNA (adenine57-N1/adenine58-N1)-methyltransferase
VIKRPRGPFEPGDQVQLTDPKGRQHRLVLAAGKIFHTHRGGVAHDELIGQPEGCLVTSSGGTAYIALRPLLADYTLSMARGAAVIYPKDAAQIVAMADVFPGATVIEAGAVELAAARRRRGGPADLLRASAGVRADRPGERRAVLRRPAPGLAPDRRRPARRPARRR